MSYIETLTRDFKAFYGTCTVMDFDITLRRFDEIRKFLIA